FHGRVSFFYLQKFWEAIAWIIPLLPFLTLKAVSIVVYGLWLFLVPFDFSPQNKGCSRSVPVG
ncbi:MAG: hypothetical protein RMX65_030375, partial [Nostoc sp. DedQUE01]